MKGLFLAFLALLASVWLALFALPDPGYVLIGYGNISIETSLVVFVVVLVLAVLLLRALAGFGRVPRRLRHWSQTRHERRRASRFDAAVIELVSGRLDRAERMLGRLADDPRAPLAACLAAARAASQLGADDRCERYLAIARRRFPAAGAAVWLVAAELALAREQFDRAQTALERLESLLPHSPERLRLVARLHLGRQDWEALRDLLPELRRSGALDEAQWQRLAVQVYQARIRALAQAGDLETLRAGWSQLPPPVRQDDALRALYASRLMRLGAHDQAERLLREALAEHWNPDLVRLYGELETDDTMALQKQAEDWLSGHPEDPVLLQTLARISLRNQLWGKARNYLEASIALQPTPESYRLLGDLRRQLGEPEAAAECYRKGLALPAGPLPQAQALSGESASTGRLQLPL
ncbi:MAG TPA: heme biosynthesis protein HemY [Gammaproteobacteria bacterium]|nr:heme biosynthesis protein HemY [Gammaproteobacteria bacterium]